MARNTAGLNVKVLASERHAGLGGAAMEALLSWYFGEFGGSEITDDLRLGNEGGRRLMARFGFVHDPSVAGVHFMRLSRAAWAARGGDGARR